MKSRREQKMIKKLSYMYRASLAEYASTRDRDKKLGNIFLCENISRTIRNRTTLLLCLLLYNCGVGGHNAHQTDQWSTIHSAIGVRETQPYLGGKEKLSLRMTTRKRQKRSPVDQCGKDNKKPSIINAFSLHNFWSKFT